MKVLREHIEGQLIGICLFQRDMVSMKMAEDYICCLQQNCDNPPANCTSSGNLNGMREQTMPFVAQGYSRIDAPLAGPDDKAHSSNAQRLGA